MNDRPTGGYVKVFFLHRNWFSVRYSNYIEFGLMTSPVTVCSHLKAATSAKVYPPKNTINLSKKKYQKHFLLGTRDIYFPAEVIFFPTPLYGESFFPPVFFYLKGGSEKNFVTEECIFSSFFPAKLIFPYFSLSPQGGGRKMENIYP